MARSYNGSTDTITTSFNIPVAPWTFSFWINPNGATQFHNVIADMGTTHSLILQMRGSAGTGPYGVCMIENGISIVVNTTDTPVAIGVWSHVGITFSANNGNYLPYVNGVLDTNLNSANPQSTGLISTALTIGTAGNMQGSLADVACWNVVLTAGEIKALSQGQRPWMVRSASLKGFWPFDGLQSPEPDLSGFANNGTLTGTSLASGPPFTMLTPRTPQFTAVASAVVFRRTLAQLGVRVGSRQIQGWAQ